MTTKTFRFSAAPARDYPGKWIAKVQSAPKIAGFDFGHLGGIKETYLGMFGSKAAALVAIAAEKSRLINASSPREMAG